MPANYNKICVDCVHCKSAPRYDPPFACHAPRDLVTGTAPTMYPAARSMRAKSAACGPNGKLYADARAKSAHKPQTHNHRRKTNGQIVRA